MKRSHHQHEHGSGTSGNIKVAFFLNLSFTILEVVGGLWTHSIAILSDALHDFGDSLSLGIAWYLERYSEKGPDQSFTFGYARFSLLGALINSLILVGGSVLILAQAIPRILHPERVNPEGMLLFAIIGILANGMAALVLRKGSSLNEKVVLWHLMEDVLGWVAILFASVFLMFVDFPMIDPILSVLITLYVLYHVWINLREVLTILLQGVPKNHSIHEIEQELLQIDGVKSVHHTHLWSLEGKNTMLSTHVLIRDGTDQEDIMQIKHIIKQVMKEKGISHVTVEIEFESEECKDQHCHEAG